MIHHDAWWHQQYSEATSENSVAVLKLAIKEFGTPAAILSDNGSCFVGVRRKNPTKTWTATIFEAELLDRGIALINTRPCHPADQLQARAVPPYPRR